MVNGRRPWWKDLYQRYMGVVNTFVNNEDRGDSNGTRETPEKHASLGSKVGGGGEGNRTPGPLLAKQVLSR